MKTLTSLLIVAVAIFCLTGCDENIAKKGNDRATAQADAQATAVQVSNTSSGLSNSKSQPDPFVGIWSGKYAGIDDRIVIEAGASEGEYTVHLHKDFVNSPTLTAKQTDDSTLKISQQPISGAPGSAVFTFDGVNMKLEQSGLGMTMKGHYSRQPADPTVSTSKTESATKHKVALPSNLPNDIPIYPKASATMAFGKEIKTVRFESSQTPSDVHDFYVRELKKHGWKIVNDATQAVQAIKKSPKRMISISFLQQRDPHPDDILEFVVQYN